MGNLETVEDGRWIKQDGTEINTESDDFLSLADHIDSLIKVAEISSVYSRFEEMVNKDVTLIIESKPDTDSEGNELRVVEFKIRVNNWKDYMGGSSGYSRMEDNIDYQASSDEPTELMYELGAFFHFVEISAHKLLDNRRTMNLFFRLGNSTDEYVTYTAQITVSKFDDA